jgi:nucleoside-diphosphate-sugar epimerase
LTGRALITGASGFLGRHLCAALKRRGVTTIALARPGSQESPTDERIALTDETDSRELERALSAASAQWVFHLAGRPTAPVLSDLYRANAVYGASLLQAARAASDPPVVLLAGTAAEYGPAAAGQGEVGEDIVCMPTTPYGITKLAQTLHGLAWPDRLVVARMFNPVGPGMPRHLALGDFAHQIAKMEPTGGRLVTGQLSVERDFVDVGSVVEALIGLVLSPPDRPLVVNICSGVGTSLRDLLDGLILASGKSIAVEERDDRGSATTKGLSRFVGDPKRLARQGLAVLPPEPKALGRALLDSS